MLDKYLGIAFILIVVYLVLSNKDGFDSAIRGLGGLNIASIGALQGRDVNAFGVNIGGSSVGNVGGLPGGGFPGGYPGGSQGLFGR